VSGQAVALVVVGEDGEQRPGWALRAGDLIDRTDYDHDRRLLTVHTRLGPRLSLWSRLRRWWEGRR